MTTDAFVPRAEIRPTSRISALPGLEPCPPGLLWYYSCCQVSRKLGWYVMGHHMAGRGWILPCHHEGKEANLGVSCCIACGSKLPDADDIEQRRPMSTYHVVVHEPLSRMPIVTDNPHKVGPVWGMLEVYIDEIRQYKPSRIEIIGNDLRWFKSIVDEPDQPSLTALTF